MSDFIRSEGSDEVHLIAEIGPERTTTVCGREVIGERVDSDEGRLCANCKGGSK